MVLFLEKYCFKKHWGRRRRRHAEMKNEPESDRALMLDSVAVIWDFVLKIERENVFKEMIFLTQHKLV